MVRQRFQRRESTQNCRGAMQGVERNVQRLREEIELKRKIVVNATKSQGTLQHEGYLQR